MLKRMKPSSITYLAYVLLLLAFISLHVFVAALALGSGLAAVAGAALVVSLAAAVFGFRLGASRLARASEAAGSTHKLSFWADQLEQDRIGRYRATYRREPDLFNLKHA
jgi:O-antigen ligase